MLTPDELLLLESLLTRERHTAGCARAPLYDSIEPGDLVQLRPGADPTWGTSFLLVCQIREDGRVVGQILRPHRGGYREAWYSYSPPEVARIGRSPFPEPGAAIRSWSYDPCLVCLARLQRRKPMGREIGKNGKARSG